ncbi:Ankyrin repeat protein [Neofusicoccum parvum]|uniref:Ankyrin repeat protein n=1 Tax=Neofusicoccum parvum TaxID=310453 RepID=A0ACB5SMC6_9PEZI|nr:Ankyrin repeat protein [Neofusicoccum parvum]
MFEPITITYSVVNVTSVVLSTAKELSTLRDKYQNAANTITAICAESSSISASLSQIQGLLLRDAANLESHFHNRPELRETFDTALTGCTVVYACLEEEIQRLTAGARDAEAVTWKVRCRFIWREDTMRDLLSQLRGQQMALNLLIQMLQLESLTELKQLMRDNNAMISRVAQRSKSIRETNPRIGVRVSSVFTRDRDSVMDNASTIDQTEFEFDDTIVNSRAYRRALAAAQQRPSNGRSVTEPAPDNVPDLENLEIDTIKNFEKNGEETIEAALEDKSGSEPDDDDAETLIERVCSSGTDSQTSKSSGNVETSNPELVSIQQQLTMSETSYINKLNILRTFIEEPVSRRWPEAWSQFEALKQTETIRQCSTTHLLEPLKKSPASSQSLLKAFTRWSKQAGPIYHTYFQQYPRTASAIRACSETDPTFGKFISTFSSTHSLDDLLRQPLRRLDHYHQTWARILQASSPGPAPGIQDFSDRLSELKAACDADLAGAQHAASLKELHRHISAVAPAHGETLDFLGRGRRLVRQDARLACRANAKGPWRPVRAVLLDNYLFFGRWDKAAARGGGDAQAGREMWYSKKIKGAGEKAGVYLEKPIPVRDIQCSISGAPRKPSKASVLDDLPRGSELFPFFVQTEDVVHLLAAPTENERREWMAAVMAAQSG